MSSYEAAKVIIFDWDDTICPSSYFDRTQIERADAGLPPRIRAVLGEIAKCAALCLKEASEYGQVIIITNSDEGWVRYSCERILPSLLSTLDKYKIVSARTQYEKFYPGQPLCWKAAAFAQEASQALQTYYQPQSCPEGSDRISTCPTLEDSDVSSEDDSSTENSAPESLKHQIISFGDSMEERTAVRIVSEQLNAVPKSVMFVFAPNLYQIIGQLRLLTQHMDYVCNENITMDLEITVDQAAESAKAHFREIGCPNLAAKEFVQEMSSARRQAKKQLVSNDDDPMQEDK